MKKIKIGAIANTHALKGEVKVKSFSAFNKERFKKGATLFISYRDEMIDVNVQSFRETKDMVFLQFKEYQSINDVEQYKGCELYMNESDLHELDEGEVYYSDLMGCEVYDETASLLGVVEDVLETGANAVLRVNKTILIPYVAEFIVEVDIKNKKIVIQKMEGLL